MANCPHCGQPYHLLNEQELLKVLAEGSPKRDVYRGANSDRWFVTYVGLEVDPEAVTSLRAKGLIVDTYKNLSDGCYTLAQPPTAESQE